ncbi:NUDIX hydrolase [Clostridium sp. 'White wine YQ']|uniref:NUDIX hydrolase n=1 Tax=Clostridium sp. 'White wine YQ' TaxID=3027474 RepID=UPI002366D185|nr:NUDIX hydrolase [Clostridium sp. 'White wine YQ']MDD7796330.1 NUDIX hydrolase [Clostridium sp. 'White wine YQ']
MSWVNDIERYNPYNEQEKKDKEMMLYYINAFENVLTRENEIAHMTSSAFVLNKERDKVLMIYHNIYDSWGWTGGHSDGEKDLLAVAIREAREETGIKIASPITTEIFSLDVLPVAGHVKNGNYVSAHLHLSVTYLLEADEEEELIIKEDENSGVKWIPIDEVVDASNEPHMKKVYSKIISKIKLL